MSNRTLVTMDQPPPDGDANLGPRTLAIVLAMFALSLLLFYVPRIYMHLITKNQLKAADHIISLAVVSGDVGIAFIKKRNIDVPLGARSPHSRIDRSCRRGGVWSLQLLPITGRKGRHKVLS